MMPQDTTREKRSKWGLFGHKGDKDHDNNNVNHDAATNSAAPDSTYGGSEASATPGNSLDDYNNPNNPNNNNNNNNNNNKNHSLKNDNDNSQTVTTTTTTTTTTTSGPGSNTSSSHNADPSQRGNNGYDYENTDRPSIPAKSTRRDHSPTMGTNYSRPSNTSPMTPDAHPNALSSNPANSQYGPHSTTLQGLKTAAAGIHGAGETLRGTVNSAVDRRFNEQPATVAAHQQIAEQGRREIETGRLNHSGSTATQNTYHPNVDGGVGMPRKGILRRKVDDKEGNLRPVGF